MLPGFDILYQFSHLQKTQKTRTECAVNELTSHLEHGLFRFHLYKMHLQLTELMNKKRVLNSVLFHAPFSVTIKLITC